MTSTTIARTLALTSLIAAAAIPARRSALGWGATHHERTTELPGDEFLPVTDLIATRAITVRRPSDEIWPWLAQLGQQHCGFYSYDFLENLVGCRMHSADHIVADWQSIAVGDEVDLAPGVGLTVAEVEPGRSLVLHGAFSFPGTAAPYDFTWAFVLGHQPDGTTRLIARERYRYLRSWAPLLVEPVQLVSLLMSSKMLRGVRDRAESQPPKAVATQSVAPVSPLIGERDALARFENEGGRIPPTHEARNVAPALPGPR